MNSNREIRVMIFEPGKEPYTAVLEDSLEHRQALVGGEIECISLPHETVLCCNAGGKWMGLPVNRQLRNDTIHGTFFLYGDTPEGHGLSLTENQIAQYRNNYNQQVRAYNKLVRSLPTGFLLRVMNYQTIDTTYTDYDAPEDAPQNLFGGGDGD